MQFSSKKIIANLLDKEEQRIAILGTNGKLEEIFVSDGEASDSLGAIYKARVKNIVSGVSAAFLDLGNGNTVFLSLKESRNTLTVGQHVIVQMTKPSVKGKVARVTTKISLSSHSLVLLVNERTVGVSKNITAEDKKETLHKLARKICPRGFGVIIRTLAESATEADLAAEVDDLLAKWQEIQSRSDSLTHPALLYKESSLIENVLKKYLSSEFDEIVTDCPASLDEIKKIVSGIVASREVNLYSGNTPLFELYGIEKAIDSLLERKVWLDSGAFLVIDRAEALTVIDVNTGKFLGHKGLAETVLATNLEACDEIVRQLRLRAIGGIVVVDFIDMFSKEDAERVIAKLEDLFKKERSHARLFGITNLGLAQITRKKERKELATLLASTCPMCGGKGIVPRPRSCAVKVKRFIRKIVSASHPEALLIQCSAEVAAHIKKYFLASWEKEFEVKIFLSEDHSMSNGDFKLLQSGTIEEIEATRKNN